MITLDSSVKSLIVKLNAAKTTNDMPIIICYEQRTKRASGVIGTATSYVPTVIVNSDNKESDTVTNGTSEVTILSAPTADDGITSYEKIVNFISICNEDTAAKTVTLQINDNGTKRTIFSLILQSGSHLIYNRYHGFQLFTNTGA